MNMHMDNTTFWHKNQVVVVSTNVDPDLLWSNIHEAFKSDLVAHEVLPNLDLNRFETIQHSTNHHHFAEITTPMRGNAENVDLSSSDHTLDVIKKMEGMKGRIGYDYNVIPHWLHASVDNTHGCPVSPPYPVEGSEGKGRYKITLPQLPINLQSATGKGVTVFVLDTLPKRDQIDVAADKADDHNTLLKEMAAGMKDTEPYDASPPAINLNYSFDGIIPDPADSAKTGKDIYGRLVGFPMNDHGLAIAGIVRDIAPDANIECIRVLNEYGVGDLRTLLKALAYIHKRGEALGLPVVINLSLVLFPDKQHIHDGSMPSIEGIIATSQGVLYSVLNQAGSEAIFVASAGNDSDPRDTEMNPSEVRFSARYPAAFADDRRHSITTMIPVGAVNKDRKAAFYSNYPGQSGIATYGGDLPRPHPWLPAATSYAITQVDNTAPIDAICGIYTAAEYPALSMNDNYSLQMHSTQMESTPQEQPMGYPMYHASNAHAWAYWSGTSYATPIISALAARVVECDLKSGKKSDIRKVISDAAQERQEMWTRVVEDNEKSEPKDLDGKVILAVQDWWPEKTLFSRYTPTADLTAKAACREA